MESKLSFVPARAVHIAHLKDRLRDADVREVWDAYHFTPYMALATSVRWSRKAWAAELDGEPIAIWGVAPFGSWLGDKGSPWLLGSDRMKEVSIIGARVSQPFVLEMLSMFTMLENYVSNDNKLSIRWLRWCGFKMDHPEPFGLERKLFRRFWMKKGG